MKIKGKKITTSLDEWHKERAAMLNNGMELGENHFKEMMRNALDVPSRQEVSNMVRDAIDRCAGSRP